MSARYVVVPVTPTEAMVAAFIDGDLCAEHRLDYDLEGVPGCPECTAPSLAAALAAGAVPLADVPGARDTLARLFYEAVAINRGYITPWDRLIAKTQAPWIREGERACVLLDRALARR